MHSPSFWTICMSFHRLSQQIPTVQSWQLHHSIGNSLIGLLTKKLRCGAKSDEMLELSLTHSSTSIHNHEARMAILESFHHSSQLSVKTSAAQSVQSLAPIRSPTSHAATDSAESASKQKAKATMTVQRADSR
jgi:hypothetical protein